MIRSTCNRTCGVARATMPRCWTKYGGDERKALTAYNWGPGNLDKVGGDVTKAPPKHRRMSTACWGVGVASRVAPRARRRPPRKTRVSPRLRTPDSSRASARRSNMRLTRLREHGDAVQQ